MRTTLEHGGHAEHHRAMAPAVAGIRELLVRLINRQAGSAIMQEMPAARWSDGEGDGLPLPPALLALAEIFGLTRFETKLLLLAAATEHDPAIGMLAATAIGNETMMHATFGLAFSLFNEAVPSVPSPERPLRRWDLVTLGDGSSLATSPIRISERIYHFLFGEEYVDERLRGFLQPVECAGELAPSHRDLVTRGERLLAGARDAGEPVAIQLCGGAADDRLGIAAAVAARSGAGAFLMRAGDIPTAVREREMLLTLWNREAMLEGRMIVIDCDGADALHLARAVAAFADGVRGVLFVSTPEPVAFASRQLLRIDVRKPSSAEQRDIWDNVLGDVARRLNGQVNQVISQFNLGAGRVRAAGAVVREAAPHLDAMHLGELLWETCRLQARPRLDDLAQRIEPAAMWDDLVLPEGALATIREIAAHVRQRMRVYLEWGFARASGRGLGISAMFAGASGTGKTMAAEVLAAELRLDLYHIDLSQVVSKYIGETEKNLRRIFDAAEEGGAVLLFDEADALFGKRSEVKDSHDRHANIEVSYLLQRMESYRGLAILTTNMKGSMDPAFLRRLRFVVDFPFPDAAHRMRIWSRIYPDTVPRKGLDFEKLARLDVSGGNIRNIALNAAFLAAEENTAIQMRHILAASRSEYAKLEKQLTGVETGGWV
ncbi:MAG: ATP-binding protein [Bacteroidetes bacterium]|nr:ATP-binding protein [Bacteroidota bacterium]